jgi:hypothetical protein
VTTLDPRFSVHHDTARHQWQVIDREGSKGQYAAVIGELDDRYPTSRKVIERYCRQLNEELARDEISGSMYAGS